MDKYIFDAGKVSAEIAELKENYDFEAADALDDVLRLIDENKKDSPNGAYCYAQDLRLNIADLETVYGSVEVYKALFDATKIITKNEVYESVFLHLDSHRNAERSYWEEIKTGDGIFDYQFKCRYCGGVHPKGYVVAPNYCAFCGKKMG